MNDFEIRGGKDLARISRELRRVGGPPLRREYVKELRKAAAPMVPAVRASIKAIPAKEPYRAGGLRSRLSKATKLQVRTTGRYAGISIRVDAKKMPDKQKALPALMEGTKRPWRHPVYGGNTWVTQQPHPYFYRVVRPLGVMSRHAIDKATKRIVKKIT